jgi:hypothetical protein
MRQGGAAGRESDAEGRPAAPEAFAGESAVVDHSEEFDCLECGQHIVRIIADPAAPKLCAHCRFMPGWFRNAEVRALLAPEGLPNLPKKEQDE